MYQFVEGAKFTQHLQNLDWVIDHNSITISEQLAQEMLSGNHIQSVNIVENEIVKGDQYPVIYEESMINQGIQVTVINGAISISGPSLSFQVIDHQFQYIQNEAFQNRLQLGQGVISFDDRQRILLDSGKFVIGCWCCASIFSLPQNQQFINCIRQFINGNQLQGKKRIKFTNKDSFLVIIFDVTATCILVTLGENTTKILYKPKVYKLWENFLNKNSFSSDLHFSVNEYDQLENQILQLQKEYTGMLKFLAEPSSQLIDSVPNKNSLLLSKSNNLTNNHNSVASHHYQGLLQVSSQKLFTARSHLETKRGYHLSVGQLSENSFLQDAPLINQINQ